MIYIGLIAGFAVLLVSGDLLVRGAVALALKLGVPALIVGLTIVAFGTSAPELMVSLDAALRNAPGIAIGNVVGSNIANVLLVLGLPALIRPTNCNQPFIRRNTFYVLAATLLFIALCFASPLGFWDGAILFGLIVVFILESARRAQLYGRQSAGVEVPDECEAKKGLADRPLLIALMVVLGIAGLPLGANLVVDNGSEIARGFGVSETAIGLTIVALGTSLPELSTTMLAAIRSQGGVALGNVLGSNIFNLLAIMGLTALVVPVPVPEIVLRYDLWIMLAATLAVMPFALRRTTITRATGMAFVVAYVAYIAFVFLPDHEIMAALTY